MLGAKGQGLTCLAGYIVSYIFSRDEKKVTQPSAKTRGHACVLAAKSWKYFSSAKT